MHVPVPQNFFRQCPAAPPNEASSRVVGLNEVVTMFLYHMMVGTINFQSCVEISLDCIASFIHGVSSAVVFVRSFGPVGDPLIACIQFSFGVFAKIWSTDVQIKLWFLGQAVCKDGDSIIVNRKAGACLIHHWMKVVFTIRAFRLCNSAPE